MEFNIPQFLLIGAIIIGAGYTSFKIGVRQGAESMFDYLWKTGDRCEDDKNSVTIVLRK